MIGFYREKTNPICVSPRHCWGSKTKLKKQSQITGGQNLHK
jgi:hypothetical protein